MLWLYFQKALLPITGGAGDMAPILPIMGVGSETKKEGKIYEKNN